MVTDSQEDADQEEEKEVRPLKNVLGHTDVCCVSGSGCMALCAKAFHDVEFTKTVLQGWQTISIRQTEGRRTDQTQWTKATQ